MKFRYKKFKLPSSLAFPQRKYVFRPIIPIVLSCKDKSIGYEVLLDSGADFCIFHAEIGEYLGIPIRNGEKEYFGGVVGKQAIAYIHKVDLCIGGNYYYSIPIGFSYDVAPHGYGILGQCGFFNLFRVIFDLKKEQIELRPKE
jgi:hypothetical protein